MTRPRRLLDMRASEMAAAERRAYTVAEREHCADHTDHADDQPAECQLCLDRGCDVCASEAFLFDLNHPARRSFVEGKAWLDAQEPDPLAASLFRAGVELNRALYEVNEEADAA